MTFSVTIHPEGFDGDPVKVIFSDWDEQKAYVKSESKYCYQQTKEFYAAMTPTERKRTRDLVLKQRVTFAKNCGFVRHATDLKQWVRSTEKPEPTEIA